MRSIFSTDAEQILLPQIKDTHVCTTMRSVNKTHSGCYTVLAGKRVAVIVTIYQSTWLVHFKGLHSNTAMKTSDFTYLFVPYLHDPITNASSFSDYDLLGCNIVRRWVSDCEVSHPRRHYSS